jgi:hypothetical protein
MKSYIHLKPSLQEFVVCSQLGGTRKVSAADAFGKLIKPWLTLPPKNYNPAIPDGKNIFVFELPNYNDKNTDYNFYISPKGEKYIANMIYEMFITMMCIYLDKTMNVNKKKIKTAIYQYCYSLNITFEYVNYDSLKKSYYRYKKAKKKSSRFVPELSLF